tara:strand:- start:305 stop:610 length:306 start_codon:yes stop_codon:yes gene_type:complete
MGVANYVYVVIGFEIEKEEYEEYEERYIHEDFEVYQVYNDMSILPVFGRHIKKSYYDYIIDFVFPLTPKDLQDEIDFTRKLMEGVVDNIGDLKLYIIGGCG